MVYPFSAEQCFNVMKDYRKFLLTYLKDNERVAIENLGKQFYAQPMWVTDYDEVSNGDVGSLVQYGYFRAGVVYWMVDKVTTLDDGTTKDQ